MAYSKDLLLMFSALALLMYFIGLIPASTNEYPNIDAVPWLTVKEFYCEELWCIADGGGDTGTTTTTTGGTGTTIQGSQIEFSFGLNGYNYAVNGKRIAKTVNNACKDNNGDNSAMFSQAICDHCFNYNAVIPLVIMAIIFGIVAMVFAALFLTPSQHIDDEQGRKVYTCSAITSALAAIFAISAVSDYSKCYSAVNNESGFHPTYGAGWNLVLSGMCLNLAGIALSCLKLYHYKDFSEVEGSEDGQDRNKDDDEMPRDASRDSRDSGDNEKGVYMVPQENVNNAV